MDDSPFSESLESLGRDHPYINQAIARVNEHGEDLWNHLDRLPSLSPKAGRAVLGFFLELACQAQNMLNIRIGRYGLTASPRAWVVAHVEELAEPLLREGDEWEWRRLMEVYSVLDPELLRRLVTRALSSGGAEIRALGEEWREPDDEQARR